MVSKKLLRVLACLGLLLLLPHLLAHATDVADPPAYVPMTEEEEEAEEARIRQESFNTQPESNQIENWPEGPLIYAHGAIVMEMNSGAVLYDKRAHEPFFPASITKLLTALVALENAQMSDIIVFSPESINFLQWNYAHIGMMIGEEITMEQALHGLLLTSGN